jgi:hypothetical protein
MVEPLFLEKTRTHTGAPNYRESYYDYLDKANTLFTSDIRMYLNKWYASYPEYDRARLSGNFKSESQFFTAFFELFSHELFSRLGFDIHVDKVSSQKKTPDLFLTQHNVRCTVEITVVGDGNPDFKKRDKRRNQIHDQINKELSSDFIYLMIRKLEINLNSAQTSLKHLIKALRSQISLWEKNPDDVSLFQYPPSGVESDFKVAVTCFRKTIPGTSNHIIGSYGGEGMFVRHQGELIRRSLYQKYVKYRHIKEPLVVMINIDSIFGIDWSEIEEMLYGIKYFGKNRQKGFFNVDRKKINGVIVGMVSPTTLHSSIFRYYINGFAQELSGISEYFDSYSLDDQRVFQVGKAPNPIAAIMNDIDHWTAPGFIASDPPQ